MVQTVFDILVCSCPAQMICCEVMKCHAIKVVHTPNIQKFIFVVQRGSTRSSNLPQCPAKQHRFEARAGVQRSVAYNFSAIWCVRNEVN
jgi:hypothetical protein